MSAAGDWRQGDLVKPEDAVTLGIIQPTQQETHRVVVISHSCDIANCREAVIELLVGEVIPAEQAKERHAKSGRRLDLSTTANSVEEWVAWPITPRVNLERDRLLQLSPWIDRAYTFEQRRWLQRWLARRYSRSEFPDAFNSWLRDTHLDGALDKIYKAHSASLVGVYVDLIDNSERSDPDDPYALGITLVYNSGDADSTTQASKAETAIRNAFHTRCNVDGHWRWFELLYCDILSDEVFSIKAANEMRRWTLEHRSVNGEPVDRSE